MFHHLFIFQKKTKIIRPLLVPWMASILAQSLIQIKEKPAAMLDKLLSRQCIWNGSHFGSEGHPVTKAAMLDPTHQGEYVGLLSCSPRWVGVANVVLLSPACEHLFLSDEAMVWSTAPPLVLQVRYTLVWTSGFVIVIGHSFGLRASPTGNTIQVNQFNWFILRSFFLPF